jgi:catechol 2,3-dioxygenase-like lactoylglutathione lyase family enzyme
MINGLDHIALSVSDLDRSIVFYRDIMGLKLDRVYEYGTDSKLGDIVGMPCCAARIAHLTSRGQMLELIEYKNPEGRPVPNDARQADNGIIHISFFSTDIHKDYTRLSKMGTRFFSKPVELRPDVWAVYLYGPDNEVCALRQK